MAGVTISLNTRVRIISGFFKGKAGEVRKIPDPDDKENAVLEWTEGGGSPQNAIPDYYHVKIDNGAYVTFLQPADIEII